MMKKLLLTLILCSCIFSCAKQTITTPEEIDPDFQKNENFILDVQNFIDDYMVRDGYLFGSGLDTEKAKGFSLERVPRYHVYAGNILTNKGMEELYRIINQSDRDGLLKLINEGIDLNVYNEQGKTPLDIAIGNRDKDIIAILIQGGEITAKEYLVILYRTGWRSSVYRYMSDYLWEAIENDDYEMMDMLIDAGINIDEPYLSALSYALNRKKDREIIIKLIDAGAVNDSHLETALAYNYDVDICRRILEAKPDIYAKALDSAFLEAVRWNDHLENIQLLINAGANIRATSVSGGFSDGNALIYGLLRPSIMTLLT
jgi:ankyrin repeat protein